MGHEKHRTTEEGTILEDLDCLGGEKMVKESARKCSHCGHNGHNSRTCHGNGGKCFKLFGVNIVSGSDHQSVVQSVDQSLKKSVSMCNLESHDSEDHHVHETGYLSDGVIQHRKGKAAQERKKGKPWTEAEHMTFLAGLEKFGKGDWRGISKKFVPTRTPTQVASHAQKYFLRQSAADKKKRRSSLFDMPLNKEPASAPRDLSISSSSKNSATSSEASSSNVVPLKHTVEMPAQVTTPSQIGSRFPTLCLNGPAVLPMVAATGVPSYNGIPYMVGVPGNGQRSTTALPNLSLVPIMNYPRTGYMSMPKSHGSLGTCGHINGHPSGIPSPRAVSHEPFRPGPSLSEKDGLELKISPA